MYPPRMYPRTIPLWSHCRQRPTRRRPPTTRPCPGWESTRSDTGTFSFKDTKPFSINDTGLHTPPLITFKRTSDGETVELRPGKILGLGYFGQVIQYTGHGRRALKYAVKIEREVDGYQIEQGIINELRDVDCGQIGARVIGKHNGMAYSLLESMDAIISPDLLYLYKTSKGLPSEVHAAVHIVEDVRKQVVCLMNSTKDRRRIYTDMKVHNILFRHDKRRGKVIVKVGDLGSLQRNDAGYYAMTYPCLPSGVVIQKLKTAYEREKCLAYQLGILLAVLLGVPESRNFLHDRIKPKKPTVDLQSQLRSVLGDEFKHLATLVHNEPSKRQRIDRRFV